VILVYLCVYVELVEVYIMAHRMT